MRGKQTRKGAGARVAAGPSPRAREAAARNRHRPVRHGSIPARAGSSPARTHGLSGYREHPCVCGEQLVNVSVATDFPGPSPHARGTAASGPERPSQPGDIPACAGNRPASGARHTRPRVHPRTRGEQDPACRICGARPGPSPRARRADLRPHVITLGNGITRTCTEDRRFHYFVAWPPGVDGVG